jgi:molybdopterin-containing oxidoreductase family membrane subunit
MYNIADFYTNNPGSNYGYWILFSEIVLCGFVPALILITPAGRKNPITLTVAITLACIGVSLNRWVMVLQVMAVPILPFEDFATYFPSWQEIATTILPVAYGVILISLSYRYLPVFPDEAELNPLEEEETPAPAAEAVEDEDTDQETGGEPVPAQA